jgi:uncharacterized protein YjdB
MGGYMTKTKIIGIFCFIFFFSLVVFLFNANKNNSLDTNIETAESELTYFILSINPKFKLGIDDKFLVKEIIPLNNDAKEVKFSNIIELELTDAVDKLFLEVEEAGFNFEKDTITFELIDDGSFNIDEDILQNKINHIMEKNNLIIETNKISEEFYRHKIINDETLNDTSISLPAKNENDEDETKPTEIKSIILSTKTIELGISEKKKISYEIEPSNIDKNKVLFYSENNYIAEIDGNGYVLGNHVGETYIVFSAFPNSLVEEKVKVIVSKIEPTDIILSNNYIELEQYQTGIITATLSPYNSTDKDIQWSSEDATSVSVQNGHITGYKLGETNLFVSTPNGIKKTIKVKVTPAELKEMILYNDNFWMPIGETFDLMSSIEFKPSYAYDKVLSWSSSDRAILSVDSTGKIHALSEGLETITAVSSNGIKVSAKVEVRDTSVAVTAVYFSLPLELEVGKTHKIEGISIYPRDRFNNVLATDTKLKWSSSDSNIAIVDENGVITAKSHGKVYITATAHNGVSNTGYMWINFNRGGYVPLSNVIFDNEYITATLKGINYNYSTTHVRLEFDLKYKMDSACTIQTRNGSPLVTGMVINGIITSSAYSSFSTSFTSSGEKATGIAISKDFFNKNQIKELNSLDFNFYYIEQEGVTNNILFDRVNISF